MMKLFNNLYKIITICLNYIGIATGFNSWIGYVYHTDDTKIYFRISRPYNLDIIGEFERKYFTEEQNIIINEFKTPKSLLGIFLEYNWFNNKMKILNNKGEWI